MGARRTTNLIREDHVPRKSRARLNKTSPQGIAQEAARAAKKAELEMRRLAHASVRGTPAQPKRTQTETIENAMRLALSGENVDDILGKFNADETNLFYSLLEILRNEGGANIDDLWKIDYTSAPPTMEEFVTDEYWLGGILRHVDGERTGLYPVWRETLIRDFDLDSRINNLVITGSLGTGKTYVGVTILLYRIVLARLLRDPQNFFNIGKGSPIYYIILSITKSVVTETAFGDALNFMGESPFFKEECRFNPENKYSNYRVPLGKGLFLTAGSKGQHAIGRNAMGIMLDEGNFRLEANPDTSAYELYNEVRTRIKNRFQNLSTFLPAISILASSAADESSFTETVIADITAVNDPNTQRVYRYAVYNVKPDRKYTGICFRVAYGIKNIDPVILAGFCNRQGERIEGGYDHKGQKVAEIGPWEAPPKGAMTEIVPIELLEEYRRNCKMALRNLSGISTGGTNRFFSNMRDIEISIEKGESTGVKNPVLNNLSTIPLSQEDNLELYDFLDHKLFVTKRASSFIPLRHPEAPRYAHLDLATQTLAGLAICHPVGVTKVEGVWDAENGRAFDQYRVCVEYDFILTIGAGRAKPISFEKIQNFFIWLRNYCGFQFAQVSADTFQSVGPLQALERVGFKTDFISLVRTKVPYMTLRSAYEDGRVLMYRQEHFMREAEALLDLNKEIDHPPGGQKDTADAVAGSHYALQMDTEEQGGLKSYEPNIYGDNAMEAIQMAEDVPIKFTVPSAVKQPINVFDA